MRGDTGVGSLSRMTSPICKSEAFELRHDGDLVVFKKRTEHLVDGIVSGIIVDLLAFSLLSVALILGIWILIVSLTLKRPGHFAPPFNHFASPEIVHAAQVALLPLMGILFVGMSVVLLRMIWFRQICFFPYQCRFKKAAGGLWAVQRKLWFLPYPWKKLGWLADLVLPFSFPWRLGILAPHQNQAGEISSCILGRLHRFQERGRERGSEGFGNTEGSF